MTEIEKRRPPKRKERRPFALSEAQRARFEYSASPITVSDLARRLNNAAGEDAAAQMRYSSITFWLIETGMLSIVETPDGRERKQPTERGTALGLSLEERRCESGTCTAVVYNERAQHYVVEHIAEIADAEKLRFQMQGQPWSAETDRQLTELMERGVPVNRISLVLRRNISSIRARCRKLGLSE